MLHPQLQVVIENLQIILKIEQNSNFAKELSIKLRKTIEDVKEVNF